MKALVFRTDLVRLAAAMLYKRLTKKIGFFPGRPLTLIEVKDPQITADRYVKVKTRLCGICGTDLRILGVELSPKSSVLASSAAKAKAPMFLGHEVVGEVVEVGKRVTRVKVGDRVALCDDIHCDTLELEPCEQCRAGNPILCLRRNNRSKYRGSAGGWSEFFVRHEGQLLVIPEVIPDEIAVLIEPLSCSLHTVFRRVPKEGSRVLVVGAGMIGLGVVAALRALNRSCDITVLARHAFQKEKAIVLGADRTVSDKDPYQAFSRLLGTSVLGKSGNRILQDGFDVVYECVGSPALLNDTLRWARPRGSVVLAGMNMLPTRVDHSPVWHRELDIVGVHGYAWDEWEGHSMHTIERCIQWLASGRLKADGLLTHRFPLKRYQEAIHTTLSHHASSSLKVEKTSAIKVAFDFTEGNGS